MSFQLVRASDDEIVVWNTEHGHIYRFEIRPQAQALIPGPIRDIAEATRDAASLADEAIAFATDQARERGLLSPEPEPPAAVHHEQAFWTGRMRFRKSDLR